MTHELLIEKRKLLVYAIIECVSDSKELKFILDTGSTKTIIDDDAVTRLGYQLFRLETGDRLTTASGKVHSKILKLPKFSLFGKDLINFEASVIKFPLQITLLADGLLGMDFLLKFKNLKFDFEAKTIET